MKKEQNFKAAIFFDIAQGETILVPLASGTGDLPVSSWDVSPLTYWRL